MEQEFVNCYVDDENLSYADALKLAKHRDEEEAMNFLLSLEIGAAIQVKSALSDYDAKKEKDGET